MSGGPTPFEALTQENAALRGALSDFIAAYETSMVCDDDLEAIKTAAGRLLGRDNLSAEDVLDRTEFVSLQADGNQAVLTAKPPHELMVRIGAAMARSLSDAPNYKETSISMDCGRFTLTVQRRDGQTPHELRQAAEAKLASLTDQLATRTRERDEAVAAVAHNHALYVRSAEATGAALLASATERDRYRAHLVKARGFLPVLCADNPDWPEMAAAQQEGRALLAQTEDIT